MSPITFTITLHVHRQFILEANAVCPDVCVCAETWLLMAKSRILDFLSSVLVLTSFQKSFTGRVTSKLAIKTLVNIPPHLSCVATLPREIFMLKNCHAQ